MAPILMFRPRSLSACLGFGAVFTLYAVGSYFSKRETVLPADAVLTAEEKQAVQEKLRKIGTCSTGADWVKVEGGYRCTGGGHFVSDTALAMA